MKHRFILFENLDFSPKKLHFFTIFRNYCWLKDVAYCISLEPQEQADLMHTTVTWIFNIHVISYCIKKIILFRNAYISRINHHICKFCYCIICILVEVAFQSSFNIFLPCDNWINILKISNAFDKLNFSAKLKSQNKGMVCKRNIVNLTSLVWMWKMTDKVSENSWLSFSTSKIHRHHYTTLLTK